MSKTKLKSSSEFKKMLRAGEIECLNVSDSGELAHWATKGNPSHVLTVWYDDHGKEYLVVDHPSPISRELYEKRKIFFEDESNED